jgi:DUF177 domain-containing protein
MRIELARLEEDSATFSHTYVPDELSLDEERSRLREAPYVKGNVMRNGDRVRLQGQVTAQAEVDCDRCLTPIAVQVSVAFDVTYVPATDYAAEPAAELQEEDLSLSVFDGEQIDIDDLVREQVLFALPTRALCREDCQGLCPECSVNRKIERCQCVLTEVDPRWSALKDLRF